MFAGHRPAARGKATGTSMSRRGRAGRKSSDERIRAVPVLRRRRPRTTDRNPRQSQSPHVRDAPNGLPSSDRAANLTASPRPRPSPRPCDADVSAAAVDRSRSLRSNTAAADPIPSRSRSPRHRGRSGAWFRLESEFARRRWCSPSVRFRFGFRAGVALPRTAPFAVRIGMSLQTVGAIVRIPPRMIRAGFAVRFLPRKVHAAVQHNFPARGVQNCLSDGRERHWIRLRPIDGDGGAPARFPTDRSSENGRVRSRAPRFFAFSPRAVASPVLCEAGGFAPCTGRGTAGLHRTRGRDQS
jgi:hypothetical protein